MQVASQASSLTSESQGELGGALFIFLGTRLSEKPPCLPNADYSR
jgi:hypothetical protein